MCTANEKIKQVQNGIFDHTFSRLYGADHIIEQRNRFVKAIESFIKIYGDQQGIRLFSAPGRTEIGGNHTDHNHGRILGGSVNLDVISVAAKNNDNIIKVQSEGYPLDTVSVDNLEIDEKEKNKSVSLIRGIAARFRHLGYATGGFYAYTTSNVLKGSGLSSSAAFEVLIGTILNWTHNNGEVDSIEIAKIGQYAENVYFGKPSGLLDQMSSSVGGIITVDFKDNNHPMIRKVNFDFQKSGYALCILDTGGNHANLTDEYAAIPTEMKAVAEALGGQYLRDVSFEQLLKSLPALRKNISDRAILRAIHFFEDDARVVKQVRALENNKFDEFKRLVIESGKSSYQFLQNVYTRMNVDEQGLPLALCLAEMLLKGKGAWRVHGGGFAGTTQNFVPLDMLDEFHNKMEAVFGKNTCYNLFIRQDGGIEITGEE